METTPTLVQRLTGLLKPSEATGGPSTLHLPPMTLQTFRGFTVDPRALQPYQVHIEDIAHALSMQCRFGGHCRDFYSVAQHSIAVSYQVPEEMALTALLHDAAEAYMTDLPKPVKVLFPDFEALEDSIMTVIAEVFGVEFPFPAKIKTADSVELLTEQKSFFGKETMKFRGLQPRNEILISLSPGFAERAFLARFEELTGNG